MINPSDLDLSALLEKLSRLDPKICDRYKDGYSLNCYNANGDRWMTAHLYLDECIPFKSLACIQSALQQAIEVHDATVEVRGSAAGWTAWISSSKLRGFAKSGKP